MLVFGINKLGQRMPDDIRDLAPEALCSVLVDGKNPALQIVGADQAERALDDLAVAEFALANRALGDALYRDVDAGRDDERDL